MYLLIEEVDRESWWLSNLKQRIDLSIPHKITVVVANPSTQYRKW